MNVNEFCRSINDSFIRNLKKSKASKNYVINWLQANIYLLLLQCSKIILFKSFIMIENMIQLTAFDLSIQDHIKTQPYRSRF